MDSNGDTGKGTDRQSPLWHLLDQTALRELLAGYFRGFEAERSDGRWLRSIFTADAVVAFPAGERTGLAEIGQLTRDLQQLWDRTLHMVSNHVIDVQDDRATVHATLHATHVHRQDDPGGHLRIGAYVDAAAARTPDGWRFRRLAIRLVWTDGDPAKPRATPAPA
jgi:hypothetical protein